jgi:hypothetical protein
VRAVTSSVVFLSLVALAGPARAGDPEHAAQLFAEGRERMKSGAIAEACASFRESYALDARVGTLLNIANCEEQGGHLLLAHQRWTEAMALAHAEGDPRVAFAEGRDEALQRRIPKLVVRVDPSAPRDAIVTLDGVELRSAGLGAATPLDPGEHVLVATAPGRGETRVRVVLAEAEEREVSIAIDEAVTTAPRSAPPAPPSPARADEPPAKPTASWMRPTGVAVGAAGLVGIAIGSYFGIEAIQKKAESGCNDAKQCTSAGLALRGDAQTAASTATVAFVAGSVGIAAGVALFVIAPRGARSDRALRIVVRPAGATLDGSF